MKFIWVVPAPYLRSYVREATVFCLGLKVPERTKKSSHYFEKFAKGPKLRESGPLRIQSQ